MSVLNYFNCKFSLLVIQTPLIYSPVQNTLQHSDTELKCLHQDQETQVHNTANIPQQAYVKC